jgi:hypothetical protein
MEGGDAAAVLPVDQAAVSSSRSSLSNSRTDLGKRERVCINDVCCYVRFSNYK